MSELRALSVRQPWAWGICAGIKRTENRTWTTERRGTIAIHASTSAQVVNHLQKATGIPAMQRTSFTFGAIIGLADIVDVASYGRQHEEDPFAEGPYCWTMANGRFLKEPIPLPGKLNLFKLTATVQQQVLAAETFAIDVGNDPVASAIAEAMTGSPDPVTSYLELADEFWATGNHLPAMENAGERLVELAPNEPTGHLLKGAIRLDQEATSDCSQILRRAVDLAPENVLARYLLVDAHLKEGEPQKAIEVAEQLVKSHPQNVLSFEARAKSFFRANQPRLALADCDAALKLSAQNSVVLSLRSEIKKSLKGAR